MNCRDKWVAQFAHKVKHPNDKLPSKFVEGKGYDKALFTTPYTDNDCGQQKWGGWNLKGQQEWAKMKKAIKVARAKKVEVKKDGKTFEMRHVDQLEGEFLKLLLKAENMTDPPAQRAAKGKAPSERETFDPNADSDDEDEDDEAPKGDDKAPKEDDKAARRTSTRGKGGQGGGKAKKPRTR